MNLEKINIVLKSQPAFRFKQVQKAIFQDLIEGWDDNTTLPKDLRQELKENCDLNIKAKTQVSKQSIKVAIELSDKRLIETVLMKHEDGRNTVCVSSQVGCALGCDFCATGKFGFKRNLTALEIIEQVLFFSRYLKKENQKVTNIVFMGMGEPFLNYNEVIKAVKMLNDKNLFNIGARKISVSTVGIVDGIKKISQEDLQLNLAVSLHAPNDKLRNSLMPINRKVPLKKLMTAIKNYTEKTNRRVMIEYVMLRDINDSKEDALELANLLQNSLGKLFFVNLISYNETDRYKASMPQKKKEFKNILEKNGISVVERYRFGDDIKAACGQLASDL